MAEFNLIKIDGKPLAKLIEVVSDGIGTVYRPRRIRTEAKAQAEAIALLERAKSIATSEDKLIAAEYLERIQERVWSKEIRRQNNIDTITEIAAEQLSTETEVSEEKVDKDWTARFFNIVEDISDEEMQNLWGRVLAGEVKQPKSFSLRTLETLRNLSKSEAEMLNRFGQFAVGGGEESFIVGDPKSSEFCEKFNITYTDGLKMVELGLLHSLNSMLVFDGHVYPIQYEYAGHLLIFLPHNDQIDNTLSITNLTATGSQLVNLITQEFNLDYLKFIKSEIAPRQWLLHYAKIIRQNEHEIEYDEVLDVE